MNRLSFSKQPSVWIGLVSSAVGFAAVLGLHMPQGFEAAAAGLITALGAAFTWTQVRPKNFSVRTDSAPEVMVTTTDGNKTVTRQFNDGKQTMAAAEIRSFSYADPDAVKQNSAADLKAGSDFGTHAAAAKAPVKKAAKARRAAKKKT